jgi:hypothetical protein
MFSFIKKLYEVPEPLSVRERALKIFSRIEGLDDIKKIMLRALESHERAHTLLVTTLCSLNQMHLDLIFVFGFYAVYSNTTNITMK